MQLPFNGPLTADAVYNELKFWGALFGVIWSIFKAAKWIKEIREVDLANLQKTLNDQAETSEKRMETLSASAREQTEQIVTGFRQNTSDIVRELSELRQDFRTFYISPQPQMAPALAKGSIRAVKTPAKRTRAAR